MKNLLRNSLLVSACFLTGAVAFTGKAQAQSVDVDFNGTISPSCSASVISAGTIVASNPSVLGTTYTGGSPAQIQVTCNGGVKFTVSSITNNGTDPTTFASTEVIDILFRDQGSSSDLVTSSISPTGTVTGRPFGQPSSLVAGPFTDRVFDVHLDMFKGTGFPAGTYAIRSTVTLAPQ